MTERGTASDPVTTAIRSGAFGFRGPSWSDGRPALVRLAETWSGALTKAIRRGSLIFREPPDWSRGSSALQDVFALDLRHHLFRAEPVDWAWFTEPQLTGGLSYFLDRRGAPERTGRIKRIRALLRALGVERRLGIRLRDEGAEATIDAEAPASGNRRIDLLIVWKDASNRIAVAIEAKFGHHVTSGQLPAYVEHLRAGWPEHRKLFFVVSSELTEHTHQALRHNKQWRWMAWRALLIAHERALSGDCDDAAYRQFRRTLWKQAG